MNIIPLLSTACNFINKQMRPSSFHEKDLLSSQERPESRTDTAWIPQSAPALGNVPIHCSQGMSRACPAAPPTSPWYI